MKSLIYIILGVLAPFVATASQSSLEEVRRKAAGGDAEALYHLSMIYERGFDTIPADSALSVRLLRQAAELGHTPAQNWLGYLYGLETPPGAPRLLPHRRDSALYWIRLAADAGDAKAANNLGYLLLEDAEAQGEDADSLSADRLREAAAYLSQAADAGLPAAITMLGSLYVGGRGVERDSVHADSLFNVALGKGFPDAQLHLLNLNGARWMDAPETERLAIAEHYAGLRAHVIATALLESLTLLPDYISAEDSVSPAGPVLSLEEQARAHTLLGHAYSLGLGTPYDHKASNRHFAVAALMGNPEAAAIFAETLDIFPDVMTSLFSPAELAAMEAAGLDTSATAADLRHEE